MIKHIQNFFQSHSFRFCLIALPILIGYSIFAALTNIDPEYSKKLSTSASIWRIIVTVTWFSLIYLLRVRVSSSWSWSSFFIGTILGWPLIIYSLIIKYNYPKSYNLEITFFVYTIVAALWAAHSKDSLTAMIWGATILIAQIITDALFLFSGYYGGWFIGC